MHRPLRPAIICDAPPVAPARPRPVDAHARAQWLLYGASHRGARLDGQQCEDQHAGECLPAPEPWTAGGRDHAEAADAQAHDAAAAPQEAAPVLARPPPATTAHLQRRIAHALLHDRHARLAMQRVAVHVSDFCNAAPVREGGPWEAQLDLREDVLPATRLWMRLSPGSLLLRFRCGSPLAQQLVCSGRHCLHTALDAVLHQPCAVDIEVV
ncbi:type III secretion system protein SctP [Xanthomonas theicola]|uniref:HRP-associated protein n=1 Tax=Xanthomonas theicola TaxID=56464 RepID=A0A2S6ZJB1_9XANT|nr:type III secretion system protein SctP [Xanthomonas theicola]PPT92337.1 HRP-associated protein [Xanthomonas theicola]QNH23682.1 HRP-associated protein [Xanthomonas theicola]